MSFNMFKENELPDKVQKLLKELPPINIYKKYACCYPRGFNSFVELAKTFYSEESKVPARLREIGILRISGNTKSEYESHHHSVLAMNCGVSEKECRLILSGNKITTFSEEENLICEIADEFCSHFKITPESSNKLFSLFDTATAAEIIICISMYMQIACIISTLKVDIENVNPLKECDKPT